MPETWVLLGVASGFIFGVADVFTKSALNGRRVQNVVLGAFVWAALFWIPVLLLARFDMLPITMEDRIFHQASLNHVLLVVKALSLVISSTASFMAVQVLPITISSGIRSSGPLFVFIGSLILLGSVPSHLQLIGLAMGLVSLLIYSWPTETVLEQKTRPAFVMLMLLAVVLAAASLVIDKYLISEHGMNSRSIQFLTDVYRMFFAVIVFTMVFRIRLTLNDLLAPSIILAGLLMSFGELIYFFGVEEEASVISVLSLLRKFSLVVTFAFGFFYFREVGLMRKSIGLSLLVASLITVGLWRVQPNQTPTIACEPDSIAIDNVDC